MKIINVRLACIPAVPHETPEAQEPRDTVLRSAEGFYLVPGVFHTRPTILTLGDQPAVVPGSAL